MADWSLTQYYSLLLLTFISLVEIAVANSSALIIFPGNGISSTAPSSLSIIGRTIGPVERKRTGISDSQHRNLLPDSNFIKSRGGVASLDLDASHRLHPAVIEPGDVIFGGLFPVHDKGESKPCGGLNAETGFQRLLAMMYAIDKLNRDDLVLPGVKIGMHAHDTCQNDIYAMERLLEFIAMRSRSLRGALDLDDPSYVLASPQQQPASSVNAASLASFASSLQLQTTSHKPMLSSSVATTIVKSLTSTIRKPIVAMIGPAQSSITTAVASVLRLFQIPQISYAATSTELSDRARFDYFFRVVPPDNLQAEVMAAVVHSLKWRYVWAVGDEGPYGYKGIKSFAEAIDRYVCVGQEFFIPRNAKDKFFDDLIDKMASNERARGVVLFCNEANIRRLLQATVRRGRTTQFYWLASDSWGAKQRLVQGLEDVADGAITILPQKEVVVDFDAYMRGLQFRCNDPRMAARNPWLQEYWEQLNNCSCKSSAISANFKKCPDSGTSIVRQYRQEGLVQFVIDSVYALAHALRNIQRIYCGENYIGLCSNMKRVIYNGTLVRDFIQNVSFYGISKNHVYFNSEGGAEGKYEVYQFRLRKNGTYEYIKTGWWNPRDGLALHQPHVRGTIQTFCARGAFDEPMPVSFCSDPCPSDMGYEYLSDRQCCWHCERCHKNHYLNMTTRKCAECPEDELQSSTRIDECEKIRFVHIDWATVWPCIPIALSCLGLLFNVFILYTLIRYNKTAIIKASGRESSAILLTGLTATFITIILQPLWPSLVSCAIMRLGMPVALTMCYASIFTKTHRIYRIFLPSLNNLIHRPPFISPKSQIIMSLMCTGVSLLLSIVCLTLEPPEVEYLTHNLPETVVRCRIKNTTFFLTFIYDILVIVATTSLAWQVRSIPENFNEAKYIAFLMYSSCVVWIGLMPIYFLVTSNYTVQMTSFLLCITLSAMDIQLCMFLPKMYVVYTGNEDLLHRTGKVKFAYATARPEPTYHPRMNDYHPRNPASLAMAIIRSQGSVDSSNNVRSNSLAHPAWANRRLTTISSPMITTPPTFTMESFSANNSANKNDDSPEHSDNTGEGSATKRNEPPAQHEIPKAAINNHTRNLSLIIDSENRIDVATSPMIPLAAASSFESSATNASSCLVSKTTATDTELTKKLSFNSQDHIGDQQPIRVNSNSNSSSLSGRPPRQQIQEENNTAVAVQPKHGRRQSLSERQKHTRKKHPHPKLAKHFSNKTTCVGDTTRRNSESPLLLNHHTLNAAYSPSARSLSNNRSGDDDEEENETQRLLTEDTLRVQKRSPTLPVQLPELLLSAANSTSPNWVNRGNHYSSYTSLFFGRKKQGGHHLPMQPFSSMKPAGLVVVPDPAAPTSPLATTQFGGPPPTTKAKSASSGKRYAVAATVASSTSSNSRNSVRSNLVDMMPGSQPMLMNGMTNGWSDSIGEQTAANRLGGSGGTSSPTTTQRRRLMKKRSPLISASIDDEHLPSQMSTSSLRHPPPTILGSPLTTSATATGKM